MKGLGTDNPIKYIDYMGLDSAQRATAVALAEEYVEKNTGNTYPTQTDIDNGVFRGEPGEKVDCSGLQFLNQNWKKLLQYSNTTHKKY